VGDWYTVGLAAGLGSAAGVLLTGLLAGRRAGLLVAVAAAAAAGVGLGFLVENWDEALAGLHAAGVNTVLGCEGATGVAFILVDEHGENQIVVAPGANASLEGTAFPRPTLCQLEIPVESVERAAEIATRFFLNAAPARRIPPSLVRAAEIVVVNRYELEALPETPRLAALTLGAEGAVLLEQGTEVARAKPPRVNVVDGTGAGDAFTACLVVTRLEGYRWEEALRRACAAGAIAASRPGAQPSLPTAREVDEILGV